MNNLELRSPRERQRYEHATYLRATDTVGSLLSPHLDRFMMGTVPNPWEYVKPGLHSERER